MTDVKNRSCSTHEMKSAQNILIWYLKGYVRLQYLGIVWRQILKLMLNINDVRGWTKFIRRLYFTDILQNEIIIPFLSYYEKKYENLFVLKMYKQQTRTVRWRQNTFVK